MLPDQWLEEHGLLTALGSAKSDHLRFRSSQAALLEALLHDEPVEVDDTFERVRDRLQRVQGVRAMDPGPRFVGQLRPYQREGLGWLHFLADLGMGGILADDMGLGKTVQVLAMLDAYAQSHRQPAASGAPASAAQLGASTEPSQDGHGACHGARDGARCLAEQDEAPGGDSPTDVGPFRPSLIVVPRSVVYNWLDEASRFAPELRIIGYSGADRSERLDQIQSADVVVTSYGLLRRDVEELTAFEYKWVVLDEAQAIKNPKSQSAKAARRLKAEHRLALTGTPVENHLGDLWSIFEFLNPGMLGASGRFADVVKAGPGGQQSTEIATQAGKALRPFILRRTKTQVLDDLPEKTEQTIHCEMTPEQRKVYQELLQHYRGTLFKQVDSQGMSRSTMIVLEALLRLRQAACHPALIDAGYESTPSGKLEELQERLEEMIEEGHKALVFSQFTSMLAIVRKQLEEKGIKYEYLDGQTRNRQTPVDRFQNSDDIPVFLISLKAGGLGLNLTAADYVFILDPWWNPAVEAQAIDRAYRIGQTRRVFAYRLICEDTVEHRIAELQSKKRQLADAIVDGQQNVIGQLTRDDLDQLLS
jgi:SNF2 family DNA or RNA helicase